MQGFAREARRIQVLEMEHEMLMKSEMVYNGEVLKKTTTTTTK